MTPSRNPQIGHARRAITGGMLLLSVAGCGGGGADSPASPTTPTTPTPPTIGPPASIAIHAGDAQVGDPGAIVAVAPAVVVRDANGLAVSGVSVLFAIDSGGGSLGGSVGGATTSTATSGGDGVATVGQWRLGPGEGVNVLRATVGSLAPARLRATARILTTTLTNKPVPSGGGVITWPRPGLPLDGLGVIAPLGAFSAPATLSMSIESTAGLTLPTGITAASPAIRLSATGGTMLAPLGITFPVPAPRSVNLAVVSRDPTTGVLTMLTTVVRDTNGITVMLNSLSPVAGAGAAGAQSMLRAAEGAGAEETLPIFTVTIDPSLTAGDFDSGYRPGVDDWDFSFETYGARSPATGNTLLYTIPLAAYPVTSIWYFRTQKSRGPLFKKFQEGPDYFSNWRGLKWTSLIEPIIPQQYSAYSSKQVSNTIKSIESLLKGAPVDIPSESEAVEQFRALKDLFMISYSAPQIVFLWPSGGSASAGGLEEREMAVAYRTVGNAVDISNPFLPGTSFRMTLGPTGWVPAAVPVGLQGQTRTFVAVSATPAAGGFLDRVLQQTFPRVLDGTVGQPEGWPRAKLMSKWGEHDPDDVILLDTLQHWWECPDCGDSGFRSSIIPSSPTHLQLFLFARKNTSGTWSSLQGKFAAFRWSSSILDDAPTATVGAAIFQPGSGASVDNFGTSQFWTDWRVIKYRKLPTDLTPNEVRADADTTVTFTVAAPVVPANVRYRWTYRAATTDSVETTVPTYTKTISKRGPTMMTATILEGTKKRPIGRDSTAIVIDSIKLGWRITSFTLLSVSGIAQTDCSSACNIFTRLESAPGRGFLFAFPQPIAVPLSASSPSPAAYLLYDALGDGSTITDYPTNGAGMWLLAHRFNQAYLAYRPAVGTFDYTGNAQSGSFSGTALPLFQAGFYDYRMSVQAQKIGDELLGEVEVVTFPFATPTTNWVTKRWQFRATRLP